MQVSCAIFRAGSNAIPRWAWMFYVHSSGPWGRPKRSVWSGKPRVPGYCDSQVNICSGSAGWLQQPLYLAKNRAPASSLAWDPEISVSEDGRKCLGNAEALQTLAHLPCRLPKQWRHKTRDPPTGKALWDCFRWVLMQYCEALDCWYICQRGDPQIVYALCSKANEDYWYKAIC